MANQPGKRPLTFPLFKVRKSAGVYRAEGAVGAPRCRSNRHDAPTPIVAWRASITLTWIGRQLALPNWERHQASVILEVGAPDRAPLVRRTYHSARRMNSRANQRPHR